MVYVAVEYLVDLIDGDVNIESLINLCHHMNPCHLVGRFPDKEHIITTTEDGQRLSPGPYWPNHVSEKPPSE